MSKFIRDGSIQHQKQSSTCGNLLPPGLVVCYVAAPCAVVESQRKALYSETGWDPSHMPLAWLYSLIHWTCPHILSQLVLVNHQQADSSCRCPPDGLSKDQTHPLTFGARGARTWARCYWTTTGTCRRWWWKKAPEPPPGTKKKGLVPVPPTSSTHGTWNLRVPIYSRWLFFLTG